MKKIAYRSLKNYKYQLMRKYEYMTKLRLKKELKIGHFVRLFKSGKILIKEGYAWNGPSGPTIDTKTFMRGSLVHDAFYQIMRSGKLPLIHRKYIDELLGKMCKEDGMSSIRIWYVVKMVKLFAKGSAKPQKERTKIEYAP